jgi:hypothetical protein
VRSNIVETFWRRHEAELRRQAKVDPVRAVTAALLEAGQHWARRLVLDAEAKRQLKILDQVGRDLRSVEGTSHIRELVLKHPLFAFKRTAGRPDTEWKRRARAALKPVFSVRLTNKWIRKIDLFVKGAMRRANETL